MTPEETWEFWKPLVTNPDGSLDIEKVKNELHDFRVVMVEVSKVYDHITGGRICKITTKAQYVIDAAEETYRMAYASEDTV